MFWVCHVRGAEFERLKKLGFRCFSPMMDDYVFLEVSKENEQYLNRQEDLGIKFLKAKGKLTLIKEEELRGLQGSTVDRIVVGAEILVTEGYCEKLEGEVIEREGEKVKCKLKGYRRIFEVDLLVGEVVLKGREVLEKEPNVEENLTG